MKSKIVYVFIFIGVLLVFFAGYFIFLSLNKKTDLLPKIVNTNYLLNLNSNAAQSQNATQPGELNSDAALFDKAYAIGDRAICEQIKGESSKSLCSVYIINAQAEERKDLKLCEEITDESYRADCHDNMIVFFVKQEKNKEKCGELINQGRMAECQSAAE